MKFFTFKKKDSKYLLISIFHSPAYVRIYPVINNLLDQQISVTTS